MPEFKISEFSKLLDIQHTKAKRYTREFLGPDPAVTIQSGHARILSLQETYFVYLGSHLVSDHNFTVHESKIIIESIKPYLIEWGLFPNDDGKFQKKTSEVKSWKVSIFRTNKPFFFAYLAEGVISIDNTGEMTIGDYHNIPVQTKKFVHFALENNEWENPWGLRWDSDSIKVFRISYLKDIFLHKIEGKESSGLTHLWVKNRAFF